jgi:integrase
MASIIKRNGPKGATVWQAQIRKKGYPPQVKTFDRKVDAVKWARKVEHEMDSGSWTDNKEARQMTLSEALQRYLKDVSSRKRPATRKRDILSAAYLERGLRNISLAQISPSKVAAYRDERLRKVSANSTRLELALLSHLFNIAKKEWAFSGIENPVRYVKKPSIPEGRCPILSEKQISRLLEECRRSTTPLLYPFVLLALHTGCRSMELRGLRWSQVNLTEGYISLVGTETKSHRSRNIPLTRAAQDVLRELAEKHRANKVVDMHGNPTGLVFPSRNDPNEPRDMHMSFNRAVQRAGLDNLPGNGKLRIHDLRHLCGTFLVMNGVDLETIRSILGHRDLTTTQRYLHVIDDHKKRAIEKIEHLGIAQTKGGCSG